jgi:hypothetical protein
LRSGSDRQRVFSVVAPISVALIVVLDCSVNRSGLGGVGGTGVAVGSGGSSGGGTGGGPVGAGGGAVGAGPGSGSAGSANAGAGGNAGVAGSAAVAGNAGAGGMAGGGGVVGDAGAGGTTGDGGAGAGGGLAGTLGTAGGTAGMGGDGGESAGGGQDGGDRSDAAPATNGCSDGTREAFVDAVRFPSVAGCSGGWSVPGLLTEQSMAPACARTAGNDSSNPSGTGCTVEDLCADGWHVCRDASELTLAGVSCQDAGIGPATAGGGAFFATRQRGTAPTGCSAGATTGSNNLHGCGNFGRVEDPGCAPPFDRQIESTVCAANPPWACTDPTSIMNEAMVVTKSGSEAGGVLCCR